MSVRGESAGNGINTVKKAGITDKNSENQGQMYSPCLLTEHGCRDTIVRAEIAATATEPQRNSRSSAPKAIGSESNVGPTSHRYYFVFDNWLFECHE